MHLNLTLLAILSVSLIPAQTIQVTYQEEITFAYRESKSLIEQMTNNEIILADWSYGYDVGKGAIRYSFDIDNRTVTREEYTDDNLGWIHAGTWEILYFLSPWDPETKHLSCVADTKLGDYFFEINEFVNGKRCLLRSYKNSKKLAVDDLPDMDWDTFNVGELSTDFGDFIIEVLNP